MRVFLEVGAGRTLVGMAQECVTEECVWLGSIKKGRSEADQILESAGHLYAKGVKLNWMTLTGDGQPRQKVTLPTYPFQRERFWVSEGQRRIGTQGGTEVSHWLLSREVVSPRGERIAEGRVDLSKHGFLRGHQVFNQVVVPGAAYVDVMVQATMREGHGVKVSDIVIEKPLVLKSGKSGSIQVLAKKGPGQEDGLEVYSSMAGEKKEDVKWSRHAVGRAEVLSDGVKEIFLREELQGRMKEISVTETYDTFDKMSLGYGQEFRAIRKVYLGDRESLSEIELEKDLRGRFEQTVVNPILLDACFQSTLPLLAKFGERIYVPFSIESISVYGKFGSRLSCHVFNFKETSGAKAGYTADLRLYNEKGECVAEVSRFQAAAITEQVILQELKGREADLSTSVYEIEWRERYKVHKAAAGRKAEHWLMVGDQGGFGERLGKELQSRGHTVEYRSSGARFVEEMGQRLSELKGEGISERQNLNIVYTSALDCRGVTEHVGLSSEEILKDQQLSYMNGLELAKGMLQSKLTGDRTRLIFVTRGSQSVNKEGEELSLFQSPLWGLGRVLRRETPELNCYQLDLDPKVLAGEEKQIAEELLNLEVKEAQLGLRGEHVYVPRLARSSEIGFWQVGRVEEAGCEWELFDHGGAKRTWP